MQDLAMHILELLMNSIHATSFNIYLTIKNSIKENLIEIILIDDGKGMDEKTLNNVTSPFSTSRTTRKIGLGVAFMKALCDQCNGTLVITSEINKGTKIIAKIQKNHWDVPPLGNLGEMMMYAIGANENIDYQFSYIDDKHQFDFNTNQIKEEITPVKIIEPDILIWIKEYINQGIEGVS